MGIKLNNDKRRVEGVDWTALSKRGTTGHIKLTSKKDDDEPQTFETSSAVFTNNGNITLLEGHFGEGNGVPGVSVMLMVPLAVGTYAIRDPFSPEYVPAVAMFGEVYEGGVAGYAYGDGQLVVTECSVTEQKNTIKGHFNFGYTVDAHHVVITCEAFAAEYV